MSASPRIDRRTFIASTSLAATSLAGGIAWPQPAPAGLSGSGHVDDACGHWPPYSHPIPYAQAPGAACTWDLLDPIDHVFMM